MRCTHSEVCLRKVYLSTNHEQAKLAKVPDHLINIDVCETLMPHFTNLSKIGFTFDLDFSPTDLNIDRGHLLIKDYLPTKFEASGAKHYWVVSCTRCGRLTWLLSLTFDLNINRDHLLIKDYLPTKFKASGAKHSWVISCTRWSRLEWPLTLTFDLNINRDHLIIMDYQPTTFEAGGAKRSWVISRTRRSRLAWPLTFWPEYQ